MNYQFPIITTIDDVLPIIKDDQAIKLIQKDDYNVIGYHYQINDTFTYPDLCPTNNTRYLHPIKCECRGLIFDKNGFLIRRAYHKFFNANERYETKIENIDWNQTYVILDKLDGSMITPMLINDTIRLTTKAGITTVSLEAEEWIAGKTNYQSFIHDMVGSGFMPIFEWTSPSNRIVLDYRTPNLILTAIRSIKNGTYHKFWQTQMIGNEYRVPVVKELFRKDRDVININAFIEDLKNMSDLEGIVVRFDDGHMVKIKTDWYVLLHRTKDEVSKETNIIRLILDEKLDDLLPILMEKDRGKLIEYRDTFIKNLEMFIYIHGILLGRWTDNLTRKQFALDVAPSLPEAVRTVSFQAWNDTTKFRSEVIKYLRTSAERNKDIDTLRPLWLNACRWTPHEPME